VPPDQRRAFLFLSLRLDFAGKTGMVSEAMVSEVKKEIALEIAHVLFIDIVGYSKLLINEQRALLDNFAN